TKPTQHSVKELRSLGIQPDMIVLRSEVEIDDSYRDKISLFCDVDKAAVIVAKDVTILYEMVCELEKQKVDQYICNHFKLCTSPLNMKEWNELIVKIKNLQGDVKIALVGKYTDLHDAYLSITEALKHAGYAFGKKINISWINSEKVNKENVAELLKNVAGILVPDGSGPRGIEGKLLACEYARGHKVPYFGICLGMQISIIEYMQNVVGIKDANSIEFAVDTKNPVIGYFPDQYKDLSLGEGSRLGLYDCNIKTNTIAHKAYQKLMIKERHRHRYEFNNQYLGQLESAGMISSGINPQTGFVEIVEIVDHPWFVACQFHPEFLSRPQRPHPLFVSFIAACLQNSQ
ncbi:MAG TPA: CTP synthase, partial [Bacilli bacterium]|nr:CTP synthase [Bacilli bacterium]